MKKTCLLVFTLYNSLALQNYNTIVMGLLLVFQTLNNLRAIILVQIFMSTILVITLTIITLQFNMLLFWRFPFYVSLNWRHGQHLCQCNPTLLIAQKQLQNRLTANPLQKIQNDSCMVKNSLHSNVLWTLANLHSSPSMQMTGNKPSSVRNLASTPFNVMMHNPFKLGIG